MRAARVPPRHSTPATRSNQIMPGLQPWSDPRRSRPQPWALIHQMPGASSTCTATCGSGPTTGSRQTTFTKARSTILRGPQQAHTTRFAAARHRSSRMSVAPLLAANQPTMGHRMRKVLATSSTATSECESCAKLRQEKSRAGRLRCFRESSLSPRKRLVTLSRPTAPVTHPRTPLCPQLHHLLTLRSLVHPLPFLSLRQENDYDTPYRDGPQ